MWAYNETFYQIYPIGFCGAPVHNDGVTEHRILKIGEWAEYLGDLGIGSIILNPIFESDNHGYDTRDFRKIDCRLGTNEDFKEVCEKLHDNNVKIMLDGVFNHVGRGFWAFKDVQEKKWDSPYKDWFHISFDGNSAYNDGFWYEGWEGHFELVKLNLQNPAVVDYLLDCVKMWIEEFGIDGLRLDVAYCLDHNFMRRLRSFCEELKPGFALIGEVLFGKFASKRKLAFAFTLASVILGAVIYYMVYQFVLWLKMPSEDMKLFSAIVVAIFLAIPYLKEKRTLRKGASK